MNLNEQIEDVKKEIEYYEDHYFEEEIAHINDLINPFIEKWADTNYIEHLLDNDENDGQRLRVNIHILELKEKLQTLEDAQKYFLNIIDEVYGNKANGQISVKELKSKLTGDEK